MRPSVAYPDRQDPMAQTYKFEAHPNLTRHVFGRQAPSLAKAVLEGAMNEVDAGATRIEIALTQNTLVIWGDGKGLSADEAELRATFGTVGRPHEEDDVLFGEFGMGRGQLLTQGPTVYESNGIRITTNIADSMEWQVERVAEQVLGCRVTVSLRRPADLKSDVEEMARLMRHFPIPVLVNGDQVNQLPQKQAWDFETDEAWYRIGPGPMKLYNRGALVREYPDTKWGLGGEVVSKARLTVTFGRNEVMDACRAFASIMGRLDEAFIKTLTARRSHSLPEAMRFRALKLLCSGKLRLQLMDRFRILRDGRGGWLSLRALLRFVAVTAGPVGDAAAWRAIESGKAMVISAEDLDGAGITLDRLVAAIRRDAGHAPLLLRWEEVLADIELGRETMPEEKLEPHARAVLFGAQVASRAIAGLLEGSHAFHDIGAVPVRRIIAAPRSSEDMWGDGESFIAVSERVLDDIACGRFSFAKAALMLLQTYIKDWAPTDGEPLTNEIVASIEQAVLNATFRSSALFHTEGWAVRRSPLTGDPHAVPRYNRTGNHIPIRDMGDVARAWAEDYCRRCPGLEIQPKATLMRAAGIRLHESKRAFSQDEAEDAATSAEGWEDIFRAQFMAAQNTWGLEHWEPEFSGTRLLLKRGNPKLKKRRIDRAKGRRDISFLAGHVGDHPYFDPDSSVYMAWLREPPDVSGREMPPLPLSTGSKENRRPVAEVVRQAILHAMLAELCLAGFGTHLKSYWSLEQEDLPRSTLAKLMVYGDAPLNDKFDHFGGRWWTDGTPKVFLSFEGDKLSLAYSLEHGLKMKGRHGYEWKQELQGRKRVWHYAFQSIGWPRMAAILLRYVHRKAAMEALLRTHLPTMSERDQVAALAGASLLPAELIHPPVKDVPGQDEREPDWEHEDPDGLAGEAALEAMGVDTEPFDDHAWRD